MVGGGGKYSPNGVLPENGYAAYQIDPRSLPNPEAALFSPGGSNGESYLIRILVVNQHTGVVNVTIGHDIGATGALGAGEYFLYNEPIPYPGTSGWRGPFLIPGDDAIRGICNTINNGAAVHFDAIRMW